MKLSIIIVNWNTRELTLNCIKSIFKYQPMFKFEVIVVDNGSTDASIEAFSKLQKTNHNIQIIKNKNNLGFAKANNIGMRKSKGENILLLNSDTRVIKGTIEKMLDFADEHKDAGVVVPRLLNEDGSIQDSVFRIPTIRRNISQWWFGKKGILDKYYPKNTTKVEIAVMAAFLITPQAIKRIGLLDERYFMFYEDYDYCRRVRKAGLSIYYLSTVNIYHLHGASGKSTAEFDKQWYRLLKGSRLYHGTVKHYVILFIQRSADVFKRRILKK